MKEGFRGGVAELAIIFFPDKALLKHRWWIWGEESKPVCYQHRFWVVRSVSESGRRLQTGDCEIALLKKSHA